MANPTPPIQSCVLRAGIQCCRGCQTKAKKKLLSVSGVNAVEYNGEQGVLTVSGDDVNPTALLDKLNEWGKKAEVVSVPGNRDNSSASSVPETTKTMEKKKKKRTMKCFLLKCFGKQKSKSKVEPYGGGATRIQNNGSATPLIRPGPSHRASENRGPVRPQMMYPYPPPPQGMHGCFPTNMPYPPPSYFMSRPPPPSLPPHGMFPPYHERVNSALHYHNP